MDRGMMTAALEETPIGSGMSDMRPSLRRAGEEDYGRARRASESPRRGLAQERAWGRRSGAFRCFLKRVSLILCAVVVVAGLTSCKPTDFFTEVVISPTAQTIDEDNPEKTIINSSDATETSDQLAALDWSDDAQQSSDVQALVTYSPTPNSTLSTHRSVFSLNPRFPGALSSDPVQFDFTDSSQITSETTPNPIAAAAEAVIAQVYGSENQGEGAGDTENVSSEGQSASDNATDGSSSDQGTDGENQETASTSGSSSEGSSDEPEGGYDGDVSIYDPNNAYSEVQHAEYLAATGQAAVMVQALGGRGALCAIDEDTYYGTNSTCVSSFKDVFSNELDSGFASGERLLWEGDGSSSDDVTDIDALVSACGEDGVIVFDQTEGSATSRFDLEQRKKLQEANIQLVPVDLSTVQGMLDAAQVIGEALSDSSCAQNASAMAASYISDVSAIITDVAKSQTGLLAARDDSSNGSRMLTTYNSCPVGTGSVNHLYTAIGTSYVQGITYTNGDFVLDTTGGLLFTHIDASSPLSFWAQAAGVWDRAADLQSSSSNAYAMLWAIEGGAYYKRSFFSGSKNVALQNCVNCLILVTSDTNSNKSEAYLGNGLGSFEFPYLIVCADGTMSSEQVKNSVVAQMQRTSPINAYSIMPWNSQSPALLDENGQWVYSCIGSTTSIANGSVFIDGGVNAEDTVRANPQGLLGSWTEDSMESVLEAAWLARIYSGVPENSQYEAICSYSVDQLRSCVESFYDTYYRYEGAYDSVVTDEGL